MRNSFRLPEPSHEIKGTSLMPSFCLAPHLARSIQARAYACCAMPICRSSGERGSHIFGGDQAQHSGFDGVPGLQALKGASHGGRGGTILHLCYVYPSPRACCNKRQPQASCTIFRLGNVALALHCLARHNLQMAKSTEMPSIIDRKAAGTPKTPPGLRELLAGM